MLELLFGRRKRTKRTRSPQPTQTTEQWAVEIADRTLRAKSADAKGRARFWVDKNSMFNHPHAFGAQIIDDDRTKISAAVPFANDIQNALARHEYLCQVSIRMNPPRVEILKPQAPALHFSDYWTRIKDGAVDEMCFNGPLFYQKNKEHMIAPSIAKPPYNHIVFTGATRSGKTVLSFACALSLAYRNSPEKLTIVLCDRKGLNLKLLNSLPHVAAACAVDELDINACVRMVWQEMRRRALTQNRAEASKHILLIMDEMDNTFSGDEEVAKMIMTIAKEGAEWGIHLWLIGQKLAGNIDTNLYQNLSTRFVGSTNGNRAEAIVNSGENSQAHKLPVGQGIFEFRNGGTLLGEETPVVIRAMYIPDPDRNVPTYVAEIRRRWQDKRPFWNMGGWSPSAKPKSIYKATQPSLNAVLVNQVEPIRTSTVVRVYRELTGRTLPYMRARQILDNLGDPELAWFPSGD